MQDSPQDSFRLPTTLEALVRRLAAVAVSLAALLLLAAGKAHSAPAMDGRVFGFAHDDAASRPTLLESARPTPAAAGDALSVPPAAAATAVPLPPALLAAGTALACLLAWNAAARFRARRREILSSRR